MDRPSTGRAARHSIEQAAAGTDRCRRQREHALWKRPPSPRRRPTEAEHDLHAQARRDRPRRRDAHGLVHIIKIEVGQRLSLLSIRRRPRPRRDSTAPPRPSAPPHVRHLNPSGGCRSWRRRAGTAAGRPPGAAQGQACDGHSPEGCGPAPPHRSRLSLCERGRLIIYICGRGLGLQRGRGPLDVSHRQAPARNSGL